MRVCFSYSVDDHVGTWAPAGPSPSGGYTLTGHTLGAQISERGECTRDAAGNLVLPESKQHYLKVGRSCWVLKSGEERELYYLSSDIAHTILPSLAGAWFFESLSVHVDVESLLPCR